MDNKEDKVIELLREIRDSLRSIDVREESNELVAESTSLINKAQKRADDALNKIGSSFDRIHDKLFSFNNILIAAFLGLSKYPAVNPIFDIWTAFLPLANLVFLMILEKTQMKIYRHASLEMEWVETDRQRYGNMINKQNLISLLAIIITVSIFLFLFVSVLLY